MGDDDTYMYLRVSSRALPPTADGIMDACHLDERKAGGAVAVPGWPVSVSGVSLPASSIGFV